jgi:hypothetical protein
MLVCWNRRFLSRNEPPPCHRPDAQFLAKLMERYEFVMPHEGSVSADRP